MEAELREARAATQQWKAKYTKAKKEMDERRRPGFWRSSRNVTRLRAP
ncbi:hypothetical protein LINPERHAP1_LOCUS8983 [Linum perenne]